MSTRILSLFILTSTFVCLNMLLIGGQYATEVVILKNGLLSLYFFLSLWLLQRKFNNYGLALLTSMGLLILLGLVSSFLFFILVLLALLSIFFYQQARKPGKTPSIDLILLPSIAIILALAVFTSKTLPYYANFLIDHTLLYIGMETDPVQFIAISNMVTQYQTIATGVHGLVPVKFYAFSSFLYGIISNTLDITVYQVYGYSTHIVFIPLLFASILSFTEELIPRKDSLSLYATFLILASVFLGFLGRDKFQSCSLYDNYFYSESYLTSLLLFFAFLSYLFSRYKHFLLSSLFLFLLIISKPPAGFLVLPLLIVDELDFRKLDQDILLKSGSLSALLKRITTELIRERYRFLRMVSYVLLGYISLMLVAPPGIESTFEFLYFPKTYFPKSCVITLFGQSIGLFTSFAFYHYFFVWLAVLILVVYSLLDKDNLGQLKQVAIFMGVMVIAGFAPLSLTLPRGGAYYFSNIPMFIAIPIILSIGNYFSKEKLADLKNWKTALIGGIFALVFVSGLAGTVYFGFPTLRRAILNLQQNRIAMLDTYTAMPIANYIRQLKNISRDNSTKDYLVYIAKQEANFWSDPDCLATSLVIPATSARPGLFALPSPSCDRLINEEAGLAQWQRGYGSYQALLDEATLPRIHPARLCQEALRLGFEGYLDVTSSSYRKVDCHADAYHIFQVGLANDNSLEPTVIQWNLIDNLEGYGGLQINLEHPSHAEKLEINIDQAGQGALADQGDYYQVFYYDGEWLVGNQIISALSLFSGEGWRIGINTPAKAIAKGYDIIRIFPLESGPSQMIRTMESSVYNHLESISPGSLTMIPASEVFNGPQNTLATWIRLKDEPEASPIQVLFNYYGDDNNRWMVSVRENNTQLSSESYYRGGYRWFTAPINWQADEWHHLAFSLDLPGYIDLYIDGQYAGRTDITGETLPSWPGSFTIGATTSGDYPAQVQFSQLTTHHNVLTPMEIYLLYMTQRSQYQPE